VPQYAAVGTNAKSAVVYHTTVAKEVTRMCEAGLLKPPLPGVTYLTTRLGVALKNSDRYRVLALDPTLNIVDQASLDRANALLVAARLDPAKARPTCDATQNGLNHAAYNPTFSYTSLEEALQLVTRDCWLGKADFTAYFNSFSFAWEALMVFSFIFVGLRYVMSRVFFGFAPAPYYTSGFGAELRWAMYALGVPCVHIVDDFLTVASTEEGAGANLDILQKVSGSWGLLWNDRKRFVGQRMVFMGVLIDTVHMIVRFEAAQCQGFKVELERALAELLAGKQATKVFVHHMCGKLVWYSCVVQSGRLHTRSWFQYLSDLGNLSEQWTRILVADIHWWLQLVDGWCNNRLTGIEYPIWSGADLHAM